MLEQNFLRYDGKGEVPAQIHGYLSTNFKNCATGPRMTRCSRLRPGTAGMYPTRTKPAISRSCARGPAPRVQEYRESKQRHLKVFRLEAVRAGFKKAWQERDYKTIIAVARRIPEKFYRKIPSSSCGMTRRSHAAARIIDHDGTRSWICKRSSSE